MGNRKGYVYDGPLLFLYLDFLLIFQPFGVEYRFYPLAGKLMAFDAEVELFLLSAALGDNSARTASRSPGIFQRSGGGRSHSRDRIEWEESLKLF